jgi:tetratricopeptide (TPR) repeat protein
MRVRYNQARTQFAWSLGTIQIIAKRMGFQEKPAMNPRFLYLALLMALAAVPAARAQQNPPDNGQQSSSSSSKEKGAPQSSQAPSQESSSGAKQGGDVWDPFHAQHDIEVATYYIHKGDLDAAIGRLEDAIELKPNFGKPRYMLAEIYEKKGDKEMALKYYKEYLQVYPDAPDAKKVQKKIEKLSKQ